MMSELARELGQECYVRDCASFCSVNEITSVVLAAVGSGRRYFLPCAVFDDYLIVDFLDFSMLQFNECFLNLL